MAAAALLVASLALALPRPAAAALPSFSYGSAAAQDPLPSCDSRVRCNGEFCADVCADGSLAADAWLQGAIRTQYNLTRARSWRSGPILGTHNGFISRSNGFGLTEDLASAIYARASPNVSASHVRVPNQRFGPRSLLDLGVRELELDLWDTLVNDRDFEVVVCHSPVPDPVGVVELQQAATRLGLGDLRYNPFAELCSNLTVAWAMQQVADWLRDNPDDVAELFLDNRVASWNIDLVTAAARSVFGASLLTPLDLNATYGGKWPSRDRMLRDGKRAIIESNAYGNDYSNTSFPTVVFWPTTWTDQVGVEDVTPFPNCTIRGRADWYGRGLPRLLDGGDLAFDPESEVETGIVLKPVGLTDLALCGLNNVGLADVTPAALAGYVWSWASGEPAAPSAPGACVAAAMALVRGQWRARDCAAPMPALCRSGDNTLPAGDRPDLWRVTDAAVAFADAPAACAALGAGWAFDVPRDGRENALVAQGLLFAGAWERGLQGVWLAHQPGYLIGR